MPSGIYKRTKAHCEAISRGVKKYHEGMSSEEKKVYAEKRRLGKQRYLVSLSPNEYEKFRAQNKGKVRSKEVKKSIGDKLRGRKQLREIVEKRRRGLLLHYAVHRKKPNSPETNEKHSKTVSQKILSGELLPGYASVKKGRYYSEKSQAEIYYGSSWELIAFELLEQLLTVKSYQRCPFFLKYKQRDGTTHRYHPDILVTYEDGRQQVIEIKPQNFMADPINQAKFTAAQVYCETHKLTYSVWTEKELKIA